MKGKIITIIIIITLLTTIVPISISAPRINTTNVNNNIFGDNYPPFNPNITIPDELTIGQPFMIKVFLTDPDGDDIYIRFNASFLPYIHNIWFGPILSNTTFEAEITFWGTIGTYTIGVQAKDTNESMSEWVYADLNFTKSKTTSTFFSRFLKSHLDLFTIYM